MRVGSTGPETRFMGHSREVRRETCLDEFAPFPVGRYFISQTFPRISCALCFFASIVCIVRCSAREILKIPQAANPRFAVPVALDPRADPTGELAFNAGSGPGKRHS